MEKEIKWRLQMECEDYQFTLRLIDLIVRYLGVNAFIDCIIWVIASLTSNVKSHVRLHLKYALTKFSIKFYEAENPVFPRWENIPFNSHVSVKNRPHFFVYLVLAICLVIISFTD